MIITERVAHMIASHPLIVVGACDRALVPSVTRGFGARIHSSATQLHVMISRWPAAEAIENIEQTRKVAITFTAPENFESYQIKGRATLVAAPTPDDQQLAQEYCTAIAERLAWISAPALIDGLIYGARDIRRVEIEVEAVFLQTPGQAAGMPI